MESFTFDNKSSSDFGLIISSKGIYSAPKRDQSFISVPGRNGDVLIDNNRYENVNVTYTVSARNINTRATAIKLWLCQSGYFVLGDTYQPNYYRMAAFASNLKIDEVIKNVGKADLVFNCKPFMYSLSGKNKVTLRASGTLNNSEAFESLPIIRIYGSGNITLAINNRSYYITSVSSYIELDSELMSSYKGTILCNHQIGFTEFPILDPGENNISWTGTVSRVEVTPRWRTL